MKLTPLKHYKNPDYPTREATLSNPTLLNECVPERWKEKRILTTMLAVYLLGPDKAEAQVAGSTSIQPAMVTGNEAHRSGITEKEKERRQLRPSIAPIFIHGDGRGSTGCVVMNPPVFLSEAEARKVIEEEMMKEHIFFDKKNVQLEDVRIPEEFESWSREGSPVQLDGYSSKFNLGYEVVTQEDYHQLGGEHSLSTVQSYDLVKAAENLRNKMKERGKMNFAVFYDPLEDIPTSPSKNVTYEEMRYYYELDDSDDDRSSEGSRAAATQRSIEVLRQQVADFIQWIKREGLFDKQ